MNCICLIDKKIKKLFEKVPLQNRFGPKPTNIGFRACENNKAENLVKCPGQRWIILYNITRFRATALHYRVSIFPQIAVRTISFPPVHRLERRKYMVASFNGELGADGSARAHDRVQRD